MDSFWALCCCPLAKHENLDFDDPLERNRVLSGPGGSKNQSKITPESLLALELAPRASWRPLGLDFWTLLTPQNGPPRDQESKLKFEAIFEVPKRQEQLGPAARGWPQWEGTFGESTYGRRWASPKLCLSQCFRDPHVASLTASSEPEGSVAGSPVGLRPQTDH